MATVLHTLFPHISGLAPNHSTFPSSAVCNVSGDQNSFHLLGLTSGHHQVWIRAETKAGLGPSETIIFSTENSHGILPLCYVVI